MASEEERRIETGNMFFLIAGIQPKIVDVDAPTRRCPSCGLYQAGLKRQDHYFSIFFLPLFRVKKGVGYLLKQENPLKPVAGPGFNADFVECRSSRLIVFVLTAGNPILDLLLKSTPDAFFLDPTSLFL
jgi:hypothetical protein